MKNINYKALSTLIALGAVAAIPSTAKAQYYPYPTYPTYPTYPSTTNSNIYVPPSPYPSFEEQTQASEKRHQEALRMIRGY